MNQFNLNLKNLAITIDVPKIHETSTGLGIEIDTSFFDYIEINMTHYFMKAANTIKGNLYLSLHEQEVIDKLESYKGYIAYIITCCAKINYIRENNDSFQNFIKNEQVEIDDNFDLINEENTINEKLLNNNLERLELYKYYYHLIRSIDINENNIEDFINKCELELTYRIRIFNNSLIKYFEKENLGDLRD